MPDHAATIRALRRHSNEAIDALDPDYVASFMAEDVVVEIAGGEVLRGRLANRDALAAQMRTPGFGGYPRVPQQVIIAGEPPRGIEHGTWVGRWRAGGRTQEQRGSYEAEWRLGTIGWEIVRETYRPGS